MANPFSPFAVANVRDRTISLEYVNLEELGWRVAHVLSRF